ncbi:hypothetical protein BBJ29_007810 [Phytophthora kernoviae]|uniref:Uncharacterized protein n=1 Tax=Phytophthora kernoviae TaxID=325452 RepID=A0A3F2REY3_9STRA|nr:hypothetical protein BBP00_00009139 [Phytophthora kernoviae]RLN62835.1 hypothetical protein BBJ29_007810 [Phytophthora kernoviae]
MPKVWFQLVDADANDLSSASYVKAENDQDADDFRDAVKIKYADSHLVGIAPSDLIIYANRAVFDAVNRQLLEEDLLIGLCGESKKDALIVVVPIKEQQNDIKIAILRQDVVWYGMRGSVGRGEDIDLNDERTLSRSPLTTDIIQQLEEKHVMLIKSPPMTGKTSLATLVSLTLVNRHKEEKKKTAIFNFSALRVSENQTFESVFEQQCEVNWIDANSMLPRQGYKMYMVKYVLNNAAYSVRILMFAAYSPGVEYTRLATSTQFDERMVFGIKELNFSHDEVQEYVNKRFKSIAFLESSSAMKAFCVNLEELTMMWRFFVKMHVGRIVRAHHIPETLPEMIARVMRSIDFDSIR